MKEPVTTSPKRSTETPEVSSVEAFSTSPQSPKRIRVSIVPDEPWTLGEYGFLRSSLTVDCRYVKTPYYFMDKENTERISMNLDLTCRKCYEQVDNFLRTIHNGRAVGLEILTQSLKEYWMYWSSAAKDHPNLRDVTKLLTECGLSFETVDNLKTLPLTKISVRFVEMAFHLIHNAWKRNITISLYTKMGKKLKWPTWSSNKTLEQEIKLLLS